MRARVATRFRARARLSIGSVRGLERDEADHAEGERGQEERGDELVVEAEPPTDDALGRHDGEGLQ